MPAPSVQRKAVDSELSAEVMASRITSELQSIQNVNPGDTAVLRINPGLSYDKLVLRLVNMLPADMLNIQLKVGTKVISSWKNGSEIEKINKYYNRYEQPPANDISFLTIYFARSEFNTLAQRDRFGMATMSDDRGVEIKSFTLEFEVAATTELPAVRAFAVQTPPRRGIGRDIVKVRRMSSMKLVVGENEITDIPALSSILAIHFLTDNISKIQLFLETQKVFDATKEMMEITQKQAKFARVPQANMTTVEWALAGTPSGAIRVQGIIDFRFKITSTAEESIDVLIEFIDSIHGPV